jgi:uncharacterized phosphatase
LTITRICIVRHGETDWNSIGRLQGSTDVPLNEKGIQQAKESGEYLKDSQWDVIITSPLQRAKRTAQIINSYIDIPLVVMDDFKEKYFGVGEGLTYEERKKAYPDHKYPNEEDQETFTERLIIGLQKINQEYFGKKVLLVCHGAVINALLSHLSNGELGYGKTKISNACINDIHFHENQWKVKAYNQTGHLSIID